MELSIISPTFNEAENVPRLVEQLGQVLGGIDYEILIVDDNSPDLTWSVAEQISQTNSRVRVLRRMENPSLGAAVIAGFGEAKGDVVACIDADLQHDPSILPRMLDELRSGSDVVVGSRYVPGGGTHEWNWFRKLESWVATKLAQFLLGVTLKDPMSGYFLVWRKDFCGVQGELNGRGFKILLEILAKIHPSTVKEVPYIFRPRTLGESKLSGRVVLQYIQQLYLLSDAKRLCSQRFVKFSIVGGVGILANLLVMGFLLKLSHLRDWRASAVASCVANLLNYVMNNLWTFADRAHRGFGVFKGYISYFLMSAVGLGVTTLTYTGLVWGITRLPALSVFGSGLPVRISCQLIAIVLGVFSNYHLNKHVTWPESVRSKAGAQRPASRPALS